MDTVKVVVTIGDEPDDDGWMISRCGCGRSGEELIADRVRTGRSKLNWGLELILTPSSLFSESEFTIIHSGLHFVRIVCRWWFGGRGAGRPTQLMNRKEEREGRSQF